MIVVEKVTMLLLFIRVEVEASWRWHCPMCAVCNDYVRYIERLNDLGVAEFCDYYYCRANPLWLDVMVWFHPNADHTIRDKE